MFNQFTKKQKEYNKTNGGIMNRLYKKLRLQNFDTITVLNKPNEIDVLDDLNYSSKKLSKQDCIFSFIDTLVEMKAEIDDVSKNELLTNEGYLYFVYPKLKNNIGKIGIHRDDIFPYIGIDPEGDGFVESTGLKFNQMVSFDENYTCVGLKYFEVKPKEKKTVSMRVADYEKYIPDLIELLKDDLVAYSYFDRLTDGRKRDLARHIYSAQKVETRLNRLEKFKNDARKNQ